MKMTEKKEIMRLFDAGDFQSREVATSMLYKGFSRQYLIVIKRDFMFKKLIKRGFMFNKYDDAMAEDVLLDGFLSVPLKKTKPSAVFTINAWLKSYVLNETRNSVKNISQIKKMALLLTFHLLQVTEDCLIQRVMDLLSQH